jgi:alkaline phosphatase D
MSATQLEREKEQSPGCHGHRYQLDLTVLWITITLNWKDHFMSVNSNIRRRYDILQTIIIMTTVFISLSQFACSGETSHGPYQTMGIKIGEVTATDAIIWTRLSRTAQRVGPEALLPEVSYLNPETGEYEKRPKGRPNRKPRVTIPEGTTMATIEGAVPGREGEVRVRYRPAETKNAWQDTGWRAVIPERDYTAQFRLKGLEPNTPYELNGQCRSKDKKAGEEIAAGFRTAPEPNQTARIVFTVSTGQAYGDQDMPGGGFKIYDQMLKLDPDFFVHTGDIVYYDRLAKTAELARWHWHRTYSLPSNVRFHNHVASYFIKDDHDTWMNDCWPGQKTDYMGDFTLEQGLAIFPEQVPMGDLTYRTYRWGKDLQIWLVEGRDYRSPNSMPDGPQKTIWGREQKEWFKKTVRASDAAFRVLISPTPLVGPDRENKGDNHSNKNFQYEGKELREFIASQKNMMVVCGDRHWQYVSEDANTGVREYSCGPASDAHAGGWKNEYRRPEHRYLNVAGGFLAGTIERENGTPTLTFTHYGVDGDVYNTDKLYAK